MTPAGASTRLTSRINGMTTDAHKGAQDGNRSGDGAGTGTGVETRRRTPDGNEDGSEDSGEDGNGDEDNGNQDRIGEGGREAKKPQNSCRRHVENGGDLVWKEEIMEKIKGWFSSCQPR